MAGAIGEQIAQDFAAAGATVTGLDIDDSGPATWRETGRFAAVDVSDPEQVKAAVTSAIDAAGDVDVLVNTAGINRLGRVEAVSVDDWKSVLAVNLRGAFLCAKYCLPSLRRTNRNIVNISSTAGLHGAPEYAAYRRPRLA